MNEIEKLRHFSPREFALFGMQDLAYVKQVTVNDATAFAIHAADGTQVGVFGDRETAFAALRQHELEPVSVH